MHQHVITITHHSECVVTKVIGCYSTLISSLLNKKTIFPMGAVKYEKNTRLNSKSEHNFIKVTRGSFVI